MTRINLLEPRELSDQHLLAELRELPRIFSHIKKYGVDKAKINEKFVLGKGHVLFFTDKTRWLWNRYNILVFEWKNRGFNWSFDLDYFFETNQDIIKTKDWYNPTEEEIQLSRDRINEKIKLKPNFYKWSIK